MLFNKLVTAASLFCASAFGQQVNPTIASINGNRFLSPFNGQTVTGVRGLVTAKGPDGFWIRSTTPDRDDRTSESIFVFGRTALANVTTGDIITLNGRVIEFRPNTAAGRGYLFLTQMDRPSNISVVSQGNEVVPVEIGRRGVNPPTEQYSGLDNGDVFAVPNNVSLVSVENPVLEPRRYGLDFWESLLGELVTVRRPRAINRPNNFGDTWVVGRWRTSGENRRGGLTIRDRDANPEAILIGTPLDGSSNPRTTLLGDDLEDITGVIYQAFGFYRILPTTNIKVTGSQRPALPPATSLESNGECDRLTIGSYNVENLNPQSSNLPDIADHIVNFLKTPDLLFLQEIQDNNGPVNDAVVAADVTLSRLRDSINSISAKTNYSFVNIDPVDDQDGGQAGANIRVAYMYNPDVLRLVNGTPGTSTQANEVLPGPSLRYNPGLIDPANSAWESSRKPIVAHWETVTGRRRGTLFTINGHWTAKGGSSSLHGDPRPPVNNGVDQRNAQAQVSGSFIRRILDQDRNAAIIAAGDFNEFQVVQPLRTFASVSGLERLDDVVRLRDTEQYTYLFGANTQALDHSFVSPRLATRARAKLEHIHVNTWQSVEDEASDHDPSVSRFDICR